MQQFSLGKYPHIALCDLLKLEGLAESGALAKALIEQQLVKVDGQVETRKRCKVFVGQSVTFADHQIDIIA